MRICVLVCFKNKDDKSEASTEFCQGTAQSAPNNFDTTRAILIPLPLNQNLECNGKYEHYGCYFIAMGDGYVRLSLKESFGSYI